MNTGTFGNCEMATIFGEIDNTLHSQLTNTVRKGNPRLVLNLEFVTSWVGDVPKTLLQIQDVCLKQGGDLILANVPSKLLTEIHRIDTMNQLKTAGGLGQAASYFN
jgi:anti-anti-sigma regulatory factor